MIIMDMCFPCTTELDPGRPNSTIRSFVLYILMSETGMAGITCIKGENSICSPYNNIISETFERGHFLLHEESDIINALHDFITRCVSRGLASVTKVQIV